MYIYIVCVCVCVRVCVCVCVCELGCRRKLSIGVDDRVSYLRDHRDVRKCAKLAVDSVSI